MLPDERHFKGFGQIVNVLALSKVTSGHDGGIGSLCFFKLAR